MYKITVVGTGYVGLVTGSCLADFGMETMCVDTNAARINALQHGVVPIYEPGLSEMVIRNVQSQRLHFTLDIAEAVPFADVIYIAVGTPQMADGGVNLSDVMSVAEEIAAHMNEGYKVIVTKSTVPIGTSRKLKELIAERLHQRGSSARFDIVSNPEFLREGTAVYDFTHPDKVVIGAESDEAREIMKQVYRVLFLNETPFIHTTLESAEMIKYANNAFLAMKISFINEISGLCEAVGADVQQVAYAIGKDGRIGSKFLHAGPGYGGSCFPKDTHALAHIGRKHDAPMRLVEAAIEVNAQQQQRMVHKIERALGSLSGKRLAVLGLTFKPKTDDIRSAPALTIIRELAARGAQLRLFDPAGMEPARKELIDVNSSVQFCDDEYVAVQDCDGVVIVTEWHQFRNLDLERMQSLLHSPYFFDLRNIYNKERMLQLGFHYYGVGV
ncbi:UDP-glucose dehydrogenase family protein [Paenibacillus albus]|uniref:UDP-glucose 6-dehydrogenase n=1 Tax=Paenibacillus albus TaxID=2495582 RepID=A0A3Q8X527_9BACL|nr:UDP-glucose/GDP-mannose dehydrogenase family protein [Paenibacillus albus]AZN39085.1 UDP-glucose/GDP-mannose dehydrogenase family protein [Paenibacillus albus]